MAANNGTTGRLDIYGLITADGQAKNSDSVTPSLVLESLSALGKIDELELHLFSQGGNLDAGLAIYAMLRQRSEQITAYVEGIAASIATTIMCAADRVFIADSARLLIHNPYMSGFFEFGAGEARELADEIETGTNLMARIYAKRTRKTEAEMLAVMEGKSGKGTWFTADEAIVIGLANGIIPEAKRPAQLAACLRPAVFNWQGHIIDMTQFPDASAMTSEIVKEPQRKGVKKLMPNFFGFGNKQKRQQKPQQRAEVTLTEMVCPHCSATSLLNPETGEYVLSGAANTAMNDDASANTDSGTASGDSGQGAAMSARRTMSNLKAELFTVTCPACNEEYVWDTDINADGQPAGTATPATPMAASANSAAAGAKANTGRTVQAAADEAVCPNCAAPVPYDTDTAELTSDETGLQGYALTCPECGTEFVEPTEAATPEAIPVGMSAKAAYKMGIQAERQRVLALSEMQSAAPALSGMITAAIKSGTRADTMSRNVIKAITHNPQVAGQRHISAMQRDAQASGINAMRRPAHFNQTAAFSEAVNKRLEDR